MQELLRKIIMEVKAHPVMRFLLGGGLNTALTYVLYLALNIFYSYQVAYVCAFVFGIAFSYWFNSAIVFKVSLSFRKMVFFPLVYLIQYLLSALLLDMLIENFSMNENFAPLFVTLAVFPVTYLGSKFLLGKK